MNKTLHQEASALCKLALDSNVGNDINRAIRIISEWCEGKVIVVGMGKAGHVSKKVSATLASTGQPAQFIHPAEAMHGDLGHIDYKNDVCLIFSNTGETDEIIDFVKKMNDNDVITILVTKSVECSVDADFYVRMGEIKEGFIPSASTTCMMAIGDAIAIGLMELRELGVEDFLALHPAGGIGKNA